MGILNYIGHVIVGMSYYKTKINKNEQIYCVYWVVLVDNNEVKPGPLTTTPRGIVDQELKL